MAERRVVPIREAFFCDGAWYVLSSSSLGGSNMTPAEIGERLQSDDPNVFRKLLADGVCLPLYFPGDCALDSAVAVIGELNDEEEREWIARLRLKVEIPRGEFMIMGGGLDEDFEVALPNADAPDPHFVFFQKFDVDPGTYLVEVYAFLSSLTVNDAWEGRAEGSESMAAWWSRTRGDQLQPEWIGFFEDEEYVDSEEFELLEYLIRLTPLYDDVPVPDLDDDTCWCNVYEFRRPNPCPVGIKRSRYPSVP